MENVRTVKTYLEKIKDENPDFVILPEMFCCPYQTENFPIYAEKEGGPVWQQLSGYAKQYGSNLYFFHHVTPFIFPSGTIFSFILFTILHTLPVFSTISVCTFYRTIPLMW